MTMEKITVSILRHTGGRKIHVILNEKISIIDIIITYFFLPEATKSNSDMYGSLMITV